jgi:hypothetical protein
VKLDMEEQSLGEGKRSDACLRGQGVGFVAFEMVCLLEQILGDVNKRS